MHGLVKSELPEFPRRPRKAARATRVAPALRLPVRHEPRGSVGDSWLDFRLRPCQQNRYLKPTAGYQTRSSAAGTANTHPNFPFVMFAPLAFLWLTQRVRQWQKDFCQQSSFHFVIIC